MLGWRPKERSPALAPGPLVPTLTASVQGRERVAGVAANAIKNVHTTPLTPGPLIASPIDVSHSIFATASFMTQVTFLYRRSHSAHASNMLTRPVGPLRKVRITDDLSLVHVVQLVNHHQKLHRYAHGTFVRLHRLPCRRAAATVCRRRSVGHKARWLRARAAQTGPSSTGTVTLQAHSQHEADGAWSSQRPRQAQQRHIACRVPLVMLALMCSAQT